MQYFNALRMGQKRVQSAREYLNKLTDNKAMPALALRDNKTNIWEPVGEENLYAFIDESAGFVSMFMSDVSCPYCDSAFENKDELSKHIDRIHHGSGLLEGDTRKF